MVAVEAVVPFACWMLGLRSLELGEGYGEGGKPWELDWGVLAPPAQVLPATATAAAVALSERRP